MGQIAMQGLPAHHEIQTTYGEYGNRKLLLDYGFTLVDNPLDITRLDWQSVERAGEASLGSKWKGRLRTVTPAWAVHLAALDAGSVEGNVAHEALITPLCARGFAFDRRGVPPPELSYLLDLLFADEGGGTIGEGTNPMGARMLMHAIDNQLQRYAYGGRVPEGQAVPVGVGSRSRSCKRRQGEDARNGEALAATARLESIRRLVEGERRIWQSAKREASKWAGARVRG